MPLSTRDIAHFEQKTSSGLPLIIYRAFLLSPFLQAGFELVVAVLFQLDVPLIVRLGAYGPYGSWPDSVISVFLMLGLEADGDANIFFLVMLRDLSFSGDDILIVGLLAGLLSVDSRYWGCIILTTSLGFWKSLQAARVVCTRASCLLNCTTFGFFKFKFILFRNILINFSLFWRPWLIRQRP